MSITWNPTRSRLFGAQTDLNRLLLLCRFDFRQKTWGLPAVEIRRDLSSDFSVDSFALAAAIGKKHPDFSTNPLGQGNPRKAVARRIGFRSSLRRSLGKINRSKVLTSPFKKKTSL